MDDKGLSSITVYNTLSQALANHQIRQKNNINTHQISIIEAVVLEGNQNFLNTTAGEKYGDAMEFIPSVEDEKVKVVTLGYLKQSSPELLILNQSPTTNPQKNQQLLDEVHSAIMTEQDPNKGIIEKFFKSERNLFPEHSLRYKIYEELHDYIISYALIRDPVILPDGYTYSRETVEKLNELISPMTRAPFQKEEIKKINELIPS